MYEIIPSPGTDNKSFEDIERKIKQVEPFAKTIHIDVVDGLYVPHTTHMDPTPFEQFTHELPSAPGWDSGRKNDWKFEVHLMVKNPIQYLKPFADAGFYRFIGQIEHMPNQVEFVAQAQLLGEVALAIDKQTPVDAIDASLEDLDSVLVMTIQAGASGQQFENGLLEKVKELRAKSDTLVIEVDGGINDETIEAAAAAGANRFVVTSFLFGMQSPQEQFNILQQKLQSLREF
jgi:ribulose-phosphate 3-epimerase